MNENILLTTDFYTNISLYFVLFYRTLSNWTYEFDKWAPSVVKISYKVWNAVFIYKCGKAKNRPYFLHSMCTSVNCIWL